MYSIWLAYTCGNDISTVAGRLIITFFSGVGCHTSMTALHTSNAYSTSVPVKLSGEYSNWKLPPSSSANCFKSFAPETAISRISSLDFLNTCSRCAREVELYKCTTAFLQPRTASKVFLMICSLDWVNTCTVTSSGIKSSSIKVLKKVYSVSEAAGNPTSISLKPIFTSILKNSTFSSKLIGTINA